jgi:methionyl-tRNA synthetase
LNFDWDEFTARINSELIGNLGNFVNRALGFTKKTFEGIVPEPEEYDEKDTEAENKIKNLSSELGELLEQNHLDRALKKIMEFSSFFNQYFQHKEPWKKGTGTSTCVYLSVNAARSMSIALHPFTPNSSQMIWTQLGLGSKVQDNKWDSLSVLEIKPGHKLGEPSPLFAKVESEDIEKYKKQLGHFEE